MGKSIIGFPRDHMAVASNGENFLVAWQDATSQISALLVSNNGTPSDQTLKLSQSTRNESPAITASADGYLVVWQETNVGAQRSVAARVSDDAKLLD